MLQNLVLRTGTTNIKSVSTMATTPITVHDIAVSSTPITTIDITLNDSRSSIILAGSLNFEIHDTSAGNEIGVIGLQVLRPMAGINTVIYETGFKLSTIDYLANLDLVNHFSFQWIDTRPVPSMCPNICPNSTNNCSGPTLTYTFRIYTDGLGTQTQTAGIFPGDYYSLIVAELPVDTQ